MKAATKFFSTQQIMFLEIHLAISKMCDRITSLHGIDLGKIVEVSEDICGIKMLLTILQDKEEFSMSKYLMHYAQLKESE
jgi:hypothetical protein